MNYEIRWVTEDDANALGVIHSTSWRVAYKYIIPDGILEEFTPERRAEYFKNAIRSKSEETAVILIDGIIAGFVTLGKCRDEDALLDWGEVWGIYLSPDYWSRGIGSTLMKWALKELKSRGFENVILWVLEDNIKARKFYEKYGFEVEGLSKIIQIGRELSEIRYITKV